MKKWILLLTAVCLLFTGCGKTTPDADTDKEQSGTTNVEVDAEQEAADSEVQEQPQGVTIHPLPDSTMENLTDAILSVSLEEGDAYVDDTGKMQMDLKIFTYDKYDMVDISGLKEGDSIITHAGEVKVNSLTRSGSGTIYINGGLDAGGFDLVTDECGVFYETGYSDAKNWYEVGEATIRVSVDFRGSDLSDPEQEGIFYPGDFLIDGVVDYNFTPHNTTIRVENGQIIEMTRRYVP